MKSKTLLLATRNPHKVSELKSLLGAEWEVKSALDCPDLPEIEETGDTFLANGSLKAVGISKWVEGYVLADDSGLEVDVLNGEPGVHSAYYGGFPRGDAKNNLKLLKAMKEKGAEKTEQRTARYKCVLVLAKGGEVIESFEGSCEGYIQFHQRGQNGFGYDPLFVPQGYKESFGELSDEIKNKLSHRAKALEKFMKWANTL